MRSALALVLLHAVLGASACSHDECAGFERLLVRDDLLDSTGFISVGERGLVIRFTDRRVPEVRPTPVTEDLLALARDPTEQYFVAVGRRGAVVRSDDNGLTWRVADAPALAADLRHVHLGCAADFTPLGLGLAVGDRGTLLVTDDLGATWTLSDWPGTEDLLVGAVLPDRVMLAVGDAGTIARSDDDGVTWTRVDAGLTSALVALDTFACNHSSGDPRELYAASRDGHLLRSVDGAASWTPAQVEPIPAPVRGIGSLVTSRGRSLFLATDREFFAADLPSDDWTPHFTFPGAVRNFRHSSVVVADDGLYTSCTNKKD